MSTAESQPIPSTQRIYEAVRELRAQEQIATRETVAELTGLKLSIVDDRLRALVDDTKLKRLLRGIYELVETFPPARSMSKTIMPNGTVKIEIGDDVLELTPTEDRSLALLQAGAATQAAAIETGRQHLFLATELAAKVEAQGREIKALRAEIQKGPASRQGSLLE
ncbi:hypothetical protein [Ottowia sp. VDI28]|uniref:hypothetical protein n=1 Tax=Ottowia sp. VDI28 TaxID=3133968 RepID=UPI003C303C3E